MLTVLWFAKQVPWQPIVKQWNGLPGRAGESLFVCYAWPGLPFGHAPPNTVGGICERFAFFFHRLHSCQSGGQNSYSQLLHLSRKAAWSEQDSDGWESAGNGKGHVGWKNWSGQDREPKMEFLLHTLNRVSLSKQQRCNCRHVDRKLLWDSRDLWCFRNQMLV